jgi:N-acetylglucosamine kinase-like BadF-type ATPase
MDRRPGAAFDGSEDRLIVAIDAGGSSTRCLLVRSDGTVLGQGRGGPGNHILSGWEVARKSVASAVAQACAAGGTDPNRVEQVVAGSAGVGPNGEGKEIVEDLLTQLMPHARVCATGDMVAAFWGALSCDSGVVVAAGTGSVCYGRNAAGESRQVGGWGQIMGDEGSAYDIAVRALRAAARAADGRGPETLLSKHLPAALGVGDLLGVAVRIYGEPMSRNEIAGLAAVASRTAGAGDAVATALFAEAGEELGLAAVTALRALRMVDSPASVAYTGAVFDAGDLVVDPFRESIRSRCSQARVSPAEFPPVVGALRLALRELHLDFDAAVIGRLRRGLGDAPGRTAT